MPHILTADEARLLNQLSPDQMQQILEKHGYAVYDLVDR
jgi:hypothetical protein